MQKNRGKVKTKQKKTENFKKDQVNLLNGLKRHS